MKTKHVRPKLGFRNASVEQQLATCARLARGAAQLPAEQQQNIFFTELQESLDEAVAVKKELAEHRMKARAALVKQKTIMARLRNSATRSSLVLSAYGLDAMDLLKAGLDVEKSKRIRTGPPGPPTQLRARPMAGAVELVWRSPMRRSLFTLQYAEGSLEDAQWISHSDLVSGRARFTFKDLKPGVLYWFRVQAQNPNGESAWTRPLCARAL